MEYNKMQQFILQTKIISLTSHSVLSLNLILPQLQSTTAVWSVTHTTGSHVMTSKKR